MQSVTQERDLDAFLNTAQLAGTEFTAGNHPHVSYNFLAHTAPLERRNVKIIQASANTFQNPHLPSVEEEESTIRKHSENKQRLRVPRRPPWTKSIGQAQLERQEKDSFLQWRRGLAEYVRLWYHTCYDATFWLHFPQVARPGQFLVDTFRTQP